MGHNKNRLDIIIVNYKSTNFLFDSLRSMVADFKNLPVQIFIQDNNSNDGVERIREEFPNVHITINKRNIGFAKAINNAIQQSSSPHIMIVNPDTIVKEGFFDTVLEYMEENQDVGILGPKILNQDGSVQGSARAFPTPFSGFFGRTSFLTKWFPNNWITRKNILTTIIDGTHAINVDWVSGACMLIRRSALNDVGLMDERFYMYWEDVDWCRRMWMNGWKIDYYPMASIVHFVGGSSNKRPVKSMYEFHKSCYLYFVKYQTWPPFILKPLTFLGLSSRFLLLTVLFFFHREREQCKVRHDKRKILFLITEDWYFWSHRLPLARAAKKAGFEVLIATRVHKHKEDIQKEGFKLIPITLERKSRKLLKELHDFIEIVRIYRREKPDIVHHVAIKPILYGSCAARFASVAGVVNALAGLGSIFVSKGKYNKILRKMIIIAYRNAFLINNSIGILQNPEDLNFLLDSGVVNKKQAVLIRGAGVNLAKFSYQPESMTDITTIICASRMIWDKGIGDFVKAAEQVRKQYQNCRFILIGVPDPENPTSISEKTLRNWHSSGTIEWWGYQANMPRILQESNIVVLPSVYGEGVPKILIEAAACGRAVVTTDIPGCREIIKNGVNGLLVPPYDSTALAGAILKLINNRDIRERMGREGRKLAEKEFSEDLVVEKTMGIYNRLLEKTDGMSRFPTD